MYPVSHFDAGGGNTVYQDCVDGFTSQESSLGSLEIRPAEKERLPGLRSHRRGSNIGHPSSTGPLPAAA